MIVYPRKGYLKKGDATKEERSQATQIMGDFMPIDKSEGALSYTTITEEMTSFGAHSAIRVAKNEKKLVGIREKIKRDKAAEEAAK